MVWVNGDFIWVHAQVFPDDILDCTYVDLKVIFLFGYRYYFENF